MKLNIIGCGEAFDHAGYGNSSVVLSGRGIPTVLFDCGYQVPERLWREKKLYSSLAVIFITHFHADHVFGIVPLVARFKEEGRTKPLIVIGPRGIEKYVLRLLKIGYGKFVEELGFKLLFKEMSRKGVWQYAPTKNQNALLFECARTNHPVTNLAVRVTLPNGKSFAVSGDGGLTPAVIRLFAGVDFLVQEAFWLSPRGQAHCDLETIVTSARKHGIKKVGVTHCSRFDRRDIERKVRALRQPGRLVVLKPNCVVHI